MIFPIVCASAPKVVSHQTIPKPAPAYIWQKTAKAELFYAWDYQGNLSKVDSSKGVEQAIVKISFEENSYVEFDSISGRIFVLVPRKAITQYEAETGIVASSYPLPSYPQSLKVIPGNTEEIITSANQDKGILKYNIKSQKSAWFPGGPEYGRGAAVVTDSLGKYFVLHNKDIDELALFSFSSGLIGSMWWSGEKNQWLRSKCFSNDGKIFVSGYSQIHEAGDIASVLVWDLTGEKPKLIHTHQYSSTHATGLNVYVIAISDDNTLLAMESGEQGRRGISLVDISSGKTVLFLDSKKVVGFRSIQFLPSGNGLIATSDLLGDKHQIEIWKWEN